MPIWTASTVKLLPHKCPVCPGLSDWVMLRWNTDTADDNIVGIAECRHFKEQYDQNTLWPYNSRQVLRHEVENFKKQWYTVTKTMLPGT